MLVYKLEDLIEKGQYNNLVYQEGLKLEGFQLGSFVSDDLKLYPTRKIVVSWNAETEEGDFVEIMIRTKSTTDWSPWMTYGKWSKYQNQGSKNKQVYKEVSIDVDEVIGSVDILYCQIKVELTSEKGKLLLRNLFISSEQVRPETILDVPNIELEVPMISQMLIHDIGSIACSPTAMTMVLQYYGVELQALDVAKGCYDIGSDMYGNWAYNVAFAAACGLEAYVDYCSDVSELITYIQRGIPIVVSVKTDLIITGAPQAYPEGHLMVVRGFLQEDETYIIVNDPASKTEEDVKRYYNIDEFRSMWRGAIYMIKTRGKDEL